MHLFFPMTSLRLCQISVVSLFGDELAGNLCKNDTHYKKVLRHKVTFQQELDGGGMRVRAPFPNWPASTFNSENLASIKWYAI